MFPMPPPLRFMLPLSASAYHLGDRNMGRLTRVAAALTPIFLLSACLLTPGKFTSTLDIRKDGSFTFSYVGEVISVDPSAGLDSAASSAGESSNASSEDEADIAKKAAEDQKKKAVAEQEKTAKLNEIATTLSKEKGYRSVRYLGANKFAVDYQISGKLDHSFLFPFNVDAEAGFPFLAIEVRADGKVRVLAPGFGDNSRGSGAQAMGGMGEGGDEAKYRDGIFTLTTDAEIISQNQEDGARSVPAGKQISWRITPVSKAAPMAVLKLGR